MTDSFMRRIIDVCIFNPCMYIHGYKCFQLRPLLVGRE